MQVNNKNMVDKHTKKFVRKDAYEEEVKTKEDLPNEIRVIAQEVKIVKALACNDVNKRNKQIKKLRKWLTLRSKSSFVFTEDDFLRIWKGLYYNMWMSDKPLVQEELAENLGQLIDCFDDVQVSVNFFGAFLRTMCNEWFGIDQWRIDKFLMLVRRMLRYIFGVLKRCNWDAESLNIFNLRVSRSVLEQNTSTGLTMHFLDIFFEELAKVSEGNINAEQVGAFIKPFVWFLTKQRDSKLISHCRTRVFYHLLYQSSLGREYTEKYNAWREMGFPTKSIDDLEKTDTESVDGDDQEMAEAEAESDDKQCSKAAAKHLDPRAGNVDVFMPELPLDGQYIIGELNLLLRKETLTKCRKMLKKLLEVFEKYQNGEFPLGVKTMPRYEGKSEKPLIKEKILQLENMENEMFSTARKLKQLNKRKRRRLLKSLNYADLDEGNFEQVIEKSIPKQFMMAHKKKESLLSGWLEEELDVDAAPPKKIRKKDQKQIASEHVKTDKLQKTKNSKKNNILLTAAQVKDEKQPPLKQTQATISDCVTPKLKSKNLKITKTDAEEMLKPASNAATEWDEPLADGEIEYFIPSRKQQLKNAQSVDMVRNPFVKTKANNGNPKRMPTNSKNFKKDISPRSPASVKRVKIALKNNTEQKPSEYIKQIKSSPHLPFDANRKPGKGLLKPNSIPSPINPFYKKKIGLRLLSDTL